jgi:hypothetical protein
MLTAEACIETDRASRYLVQTCKHFNNRGRHLGGLTARHMAAAARHHNGAGRDPAQARIEWSDTDGLVDLGWGRCAMHASNTALTLRAEADTAGNLEHVQEMVTGHLQRFGRRDNLTVSWRQTGAPGTGPAGQA